MAVPLEGRERGGKSSEDCFIVGTEQGLNNGEGFQSPWGGREVMVHASVL